MREAKQYYDELASYYHLIFDDWHASMARQGDALARLIDSEFGGREPKELRVLDAACGIGTQTLPLAARGFQLTARDLSPNAVARLKHEAQIRQIVVDAAVADMRQVASSVSGLFDVVMAFDNSLAHLPDDDDLSAAFQQFVKVLSSGGVFLCSVRDYERVSRGEPTTHLYGRREYHGQRLHLRQEWTWEDAMHYQGKIIIDQETPNGATQVLCTSSRFYAPSTERLLELMHGAGFNECRRIDEAIYQPVLVGRKISATVPG